MLQLSSNRQVYRLAWNNCNLRETRNNEKLQLISLDLSGPSNLPKEDAENITQNKQSWEKPTKKEERKKEQPSKTPFFFFLLSSSFVSISHHHLHKNKK